MGYTVTLKNQSTLNKYRSTLKVNRKKGQKVSLTFNRERSRVTLTLTTPITGLPCNNPNNPNPYGMVSRMPLVGRQGLMR